jgi:hypothetical protein
MSSKRSGSPLVGGSSAKKKSKTVSADFDLDELLNIVGNVDNDVEVEPYGEEEVTQFVDTYV